MMPYCSVTAWYHGDDAATTLQPDVWWGMSDGYDCGSTKARSLRSWCDPHY